MRTPFLSQLPPGTTPFPRPAPTPDPQSEMRRLARAEDMAVAAAGQLVFGMVPGDQAMKPLRGGLRASDARHALRLAFRRGLDAARGTAGTRC